MSVSSIVRLMELCPYLHVESDNRDLPCMSEVQVDKISPVSLRDRRDLTCVSHCQTDGTSPVLRVPNQRDLPCISQLSECALRPAGQFARFYATLRIHRNQQNLIHSLITTCD